MKTILPTLFLALSIYSGAFIIPTLSGILGYRGKKFYIILAIITEGRIAVFGKYIGGTNGSYISILAFIVNGAILLLGKEKTSK